MPTLGERAVQALVLRQSRAGVRLAANPKQYKICIISYATNGGFSANHNELTSHVT